MCGKTHLAAGLCAGAAVSCVIGASPLDAAFITGCSALGSLWPDIDHRTSIISCRHKILSRVCNFVFGERGMLHDPRFYLALMVILSFFVEFRFYYPLFMGIGTHLLLDAPTPRSIPTCRKKKRLFVIRMGGAAEKSMQLGCFAATIVLGCMWADRILEEVLR